MTSRAFVLTNFTKRRVVGIKNVPVDRFRDVWEPRGCWFVLNDDASLQVVSGSDRSLLNASASALTHGQSRWSRSGVFRDVATWRPQVMVT